jgi:hypothetical protein
VSGRRRVLQQAGHRRDEPAQVRELGEVGHDPDIEQPLGVNHARMRAHEIALQPLAAEGLVEVALARRRSTTTPSGASAAGGGDGGASSCTEGVWMAAAGRGR